MFVTFEGPEGAGKSTALRTVASSLRESGRTVLETREPGAGELGSRIREVLLHGGDMPYESELFLFLADRANHVRSLVRPALIRGDWVLCDRYADSTLVYQSFGRGLDRTFVDAANRVATQGLTPDLTILFDLDPAVGLARLTQKDRMDGAPLAFHQRVREGFLAVAAENPARWRIVDASQPAESVSAAALSAILRG
jgi:dTMP kinase